MGSGLFRGDIGFKGVPGNIKSVQGVLMVFRGSMWFQERSRRFWLVTGIFQGNSEGLNLV